MQIFVVLVGDRLMNWWDGDGTTVILEDLNPWDSILSVLQKIDEEEGILGEGEDIEVMRLFFAGQDITMPRYRTLAEWNIMDQDILYLYQGLEW